MERLLFFFIAISCFVACNKTDDIREKEEMVVYRDSFLEIKIPKSFHVESKTHWDMGNVYIVKNSDNNVVLGMHNGGVVRIGKYDRNALTEDYFLNSRKDSVIELNGKIYKEMHYGLVRGELVKGYEYYRPCVLDVSCYPDFADSLTCDNIVASIKAVR